MLLPLYDGECDCSETFTQRLADGRLALIGRVCAASLNTPFRLLMTHTFSFRAQCEQPDYLACVSGLTHVVHAEQQIEDEVSGKASTLPFDYSCSDLSALVTI